VEIKKARWRGIDLSRSTLRSFRLTNVVIEDCRFDGADCLDWGLWGTTIRDCSFHRASLRDTALGSVWEGSRNRYERVDFSHADFRGSGLTCPPILGHPLCESLGEGSLVL
jgi:uncharacterized protein YjbI with pentapeptide repeats